jgi:hypothetical protein
MRTNAAVLLLFVVWGCGGDGPLAPDPNLIDPGSYGLTSGSPDITGLEGTELTVAPDKASATLTLPDSTTVELTLTAVAPDDWPQTCGAITTVTHESTREEVLEVLPAPLEVGDRTFTEPRFQDLCTGDFAPPAATLYGADGTPSLNFERAD